MNSYFIKSLTWKQALWSRVGSSRGRLLACWRVGQGQTKSKVHRGTFNVEQLFVGCQPRQPGGASQGQRSPDQPNATRKPLVLRTSHVPLSRSSIGMKIHLKPCQHSPSRRIDVVRCGADRGRPNPTGLSEGRFAHPCTTPIALIFAARWGYWDIIVSRTVVDLRHGLLSLRTRLVAHPL